MKTLLQPKLTNRRLPTALALLCCLVLLSITHLSAQCGGDVLIDNESFESGWGIWNDGGNDCARNTNYPNTGSYNIEIRDNSGLASSMTTDNLDLTAYTDIRVAFSYYPTSMDNSNEDFWLQISTNGGSSFTTAEEWNRDDEFVNDQRYYDTVTIAGPFTVNTQLRFRCDASGNADWVYLDDIVICGISAPNNPPVAVDDSDNTNKATAIAIDVLANDSDPDPNTITINSIISAPDQGGNAVINDNGTPGNPADDFIDFTPSGSYIGVETFSYEICDNGIPVMCDTAIVSVTITECIDGSTPETAPTFAYGSEWKYNDSGSDLGTSWKESAYDDLCWPYGDTEMGFGDADETTVLTDHGGATYYFRKYFDVSDATDINNILIGMIRDDGAVVYVNGTEVYRTNMPTGSVTYTTLASSEITGASETTPTSVLIPASVLTDGDNVIAVEIHQDVVSSGDLSFDMEMSHTLVSSDTVLIASGQNWNFNDNGSDLGTAWAATSIVETADEWDAGQTELGYGDGDEVTVLDYGPDANDKYPTYYFRHYFAVNSVNSTDSLLIKLRKDDGAIVYINGTEVFRSGMPTGPVTYDTYANFTAAGANESKYYTETILADVLTAGSNVVAVEVHQVNATSSDMSFELELHLVPGAPDPWSYNTISGIIFLDADVDGALGAADIGQGAITVDAYQDVNNNGVLDAGIDPKLFNDFTVLDGSYSMNVYPADVQSLKSVTVSSGDAKESALDGSMSLTDTSLTSLDLGAPSDNLIDTGAVWKYYEDGDHGSSTWMDQGFDDSGWSSGNGDFGFGDGYENTTLTSGNLTYYFRNTFTLTSPDGPNYGLANIQYKRDDGIVIYINGVEVHRDNMPTGPVAYSTLAPVTIDNSDERTYKTIIVSSPGFITGSNTIAVEVHQRSAGSSDLHFDMRVDALETGIDEVGFHYANINIPQGATIVNAKMRMTAATTSISLVNIDIEGEDTDNAATFTATTDDISDRPRTSSSVNWMAGSSIIEQDEVELDGLTDIVQEIVNRPGWTSGNSIALIATGFSNHFYAADGGRSPELIVTYIDTSQSDITYIVTLNEDDLPEYYNFMTDGFPTVTFSESARATGTANIGYIGSTSMCIASSDDAYDAFHIINRFSGKNKQIGQFGGATEIESMALSEGADSILAVDGGSFGLVDPLTGAFTPYGTTVGTGDGSLGSITFDDIDGLAWDLTRHVLWASHRRTTPAIDVILQIDQKTGQHVPDAFGAGIDYVVLNGTGILPDIDDISSNPNTGFLFAMNNDNGAITNLIEIDVSDGSAVVINTTALNDMEGQGFHNDGQYYSTSGREGLPTNSFYRVNTSDANLTYIGTFSEGGDFEGCDCKSGTVINFIDGFSFRDNDEDGAFGPSDNPVANVTIYLYEDVNGDSIIDASDILLDSVETDADGNYSFAIVNMGSFLTLIDTTDLPEGSELTTSNPQPFRITTNGRFSADNNFGYRLGGVLPVELTYFSGENIGPKNRLYWITASEIESDFFDVLRSSDGLVFESIGEVDGAGYSTQQIGYEFIDEHPHKGINYYRLKQVDLNGSFEYSKTITLVVEASSSEASMKIWPNPTSGSTSLSLSGMSSGNIYSMTIIDFSGHTIEERILEISTGSPLQFDLSNLPKGVYFVNVRNTLHQFSQKVILH